MPSNTSLETTTANRTRWGGILVLLSVLLIAARSVWSLVLAPGGLDADNAKAAAFIHANSGAWTAIGWLGAFGALFACVGSFFLITRPTSTSRGFPASAFWLLVGVGQLLSTGFYLFRSSGYVTLATNQATLPVGFEAARTTLALVGSVGTIAIYSGLVAIFAGETRSATSSAPAWASGAIAVFSLVGLVGGAVSLFPGTSAVAMALGYAVYPVLLGLLLWSVKVAWPNLAMAWDSQADRQADDA